MEEVFTLSDLLGVSSGGVSTKNPVPDGWTTRIGDALRDVTSSELHMNAVLQNALKEAPGVAGLGTEYQSKTAKMEEEDDDEDRPLRVKERYIRNLFADCYDDKCYNSLERMNGLPITLKCQPDFAVWTKGGQGMVITCEGKNAQNYVLHNAVRQCASYMLVHLFYWVATKSKLVESVYGVAVAGIKCKDMSQKNLCCGADVYVASFCDRGHAQDQEVRGPLELLRGIVDFHELRLRKNSWLDS